VKLILSSREYAATSAVEADDIFVCGFVADLDCQSPARAGLLHSAYTQHY
jgi:hypothetical protein